MDVHKNKLSKLGQLLANSMRNITKNFRLGFGSFVEKETLPFVNTAPRSMNNPCMSTDKQANQCVPPYGYIHHMTLTDNSTLFEAEVTAAKVSGNLDSPEGGLDALMQVIVCEVRFLSYYVYKIIRVQIYILICVFIERDWLASSVS